MEGIGGQPQEAFGAACKQVDVDVDTSAQSSGLVQASAGEHPDRCNPCSYFHHAVAGCALGGACPNCHMPHKPRKKKRGKKSATHSGKEEREADDTLSKQAMETIQKPLKEKERDGKVGKKGKDTQEKRLNVFKDEHKEKKAKEMEDPLGGDREAQAKNDEGALGDSDMDAIAQRRGELLKDDGDADSTDGGETCAAAEAALERLQLLDDLDCHKLRDLDISLFVLDPSVEGRPLVACSAGFEDLAGLERTQVIGNGMDFLAANLLDCHEQRRLQVVLENFLNAAGRGEYRPAECFTPEGTPYKGQHLSMVEGELTYVLPHVAKDTGKVTETMYLLKLVELEDCPFVIGLQAEMVSNHDGGLDNVWNRFCGYANLTFSRTHSCMCENMDVVEQVLASLFWYSAPMRRQVACDPYSDESISEGS